MTPTRPPQNEPSNERTITAWFSDTSRLAPLSPKSSRNSPSHRKLRRFRRNFWEGGSEPQRRGGKSGPPSPLADQLRRCRIRQSLAAPSEVWRLRLQRSMPHDLVFGMRHLLPSHGFTAFDGLTISNIVLKLRRQPLPFAKFSCGLQMVMNMGFAGIATVAA
jgi:hypothetical protein